MNKKQKDVYYNTFMIKHYDGIGRSVDLSDLMDNIEEVYVTFERGSAAPNTMEEFCKSREYNEDEFLDKWVRYIRDKNVPDNEGINFYLDYQNIDDFTSVKPFYDKSITDDEIKDMLRNIGYSVE